MSSENNRRDSFQDDYNRKTLKSANTDNEHKINQLQHELQQAVAGNRSIDQQSDRNKSKSPPLRLCCFGSSSKKTPQSFMSQSYLLGSTLAKRGHICINGAGESGCMGAMNSGVLDNDGVAVGVSHEMFLNGREEGGGGGMEGLHEIFKNGGKNEFVVATGQDLEERKKLLINNADGLIVLPGGAGTFDELCLVVSLRSLRLKDLPIVCVNIDGFYDPFAEMLNKANENNLLYYTNFEDLVHFETTSVGAIDWIEAKIDEKNKATVQTEQKHNEARTSIFSRFLSGKQKGKSGNRNTMREKQGVQLVSMLLAFAAGVVLGPKILPRRG